MFTKKPVSSSFILLIGILIGFALSFGLRKHEHEKSTVERLRHQFIHDQFVVVPTDKKFRDQFLNIHLR